MGKHIGRPSNSESKSRKIKKVIIVLLVFVGFVIVTLISLFGLNNFNILKNDSVFDGACNEKEGWQTFVENGRVYCRLLVGYDYGCPSGYSLNGTMCRKVTKIRYDCPKDGFDYKKTGSGANTKCEKKEAYCDSGYKLYYEGSKAYCKATKKSCPSNTRKTKDGKKCEYTYRVQTCNKQGYYLVGGGSSAYCQKDVYEYVCNGNNYSYNSSNKTCNYYTTGKDCKKGWEMVGGGSSAYCQKFTYTCPKNYKISGSGKNAKCRRTYTVQGCNSGFVKVGDGPSAYCQKDLGKAKNGKCSKGKKRGKRCYLDAKLVNIKKVDEIKVNRNVHTEKPITKIYSTTSPATKKKTYDRNAKVIYVEKTKHINPSYDKKNAKEKYVSETVKKTPIYSEINATKTPVYKKEELTQTIKNQAINKQQIVDNLTKIAEREYNYGNNYGGSKYRDWFYGYDNGVDWCAVFISWLFHQDEYAKNYMVYDPTADGVVRESVKSGLGTWHEDECYNENTSPQAGDIIVFDPMYGSTGMYIPYPLRKTDAYPSIDGFNTRDKFLSSHIGFVYKVDNTYVYTIEGNRSNMIKKMKYKRKFCGKEASSEQRINGYYRPNYNKQK